MADSLGDFAGAFHGSHTDILAGRPDTFAEGRSRGDGVQGNQMTDTSSRTFGEMAGAFGSAFTDIL